MRDNGIMISQMDMEDINIQTELFIRETGKMINNLAKVFKFGRTVKNIKDLFKME